MLDREHAVARCRSDGFAIARSPIPILAKIDQAVAFAPYLVGKMGKKWHIAYLDYAWGQSTRDAYVEEIRKHGGEVVGSTGIALGTADMASALSKIRGNFDGLFGILFGANAVTFISQAFDRDRTVKKAIIPLPI